MLIFFLWPTYGVITEKITIRGVTIKKENTPMYFWSTITFFYFCGVAFPCIIWQLPYSGFFIPIMGIIIVLMIIFWIFKL
jgi:hypothetical protein